MSNSSEITSNRFSLGLLNNLSCTNRWLTYSLELIIHWKGKNYYSIKIQQKFQRISQRNTINYKWSKSNEAGLVCDDETYFNLSQPHLETHLVFKLEFNELSSVEM